uniref:cancer/testis antigen 55-like n=1 Tax=Jaculus jaculus TaxID=51337 RepID=UPI001E1B4680|nr:cancer/testis antigen 55-like [Jaculus jaculus]
MECDQHKGKLTSNTVTTASTRRPLRLPLRFTILTKNRGMSVLMNLLRRVWGFFQRRQESSEDQAQQLGGSSKLKSIQGTITSFYNDYGWINESIFFNSAVVMDDVPLTVGQKVTALVEEDEASHTLKAINVKAGSHSFDFNDSPDLETRVITRCVTAVTQDAVYISRETGFSLRLVTKGFMPYTGDLIHVEYSIHPRTSNVSVHAVSAVNSKNMNEVCITSMDGRIGVVEDSVFFTLDSLILPSGYVPQEHDMVNVVAVESIQFHYCWRAISLTPVEMFI